MPFHFENLEIPDVILVVPMAFEDQRGFFMETYKQSDFEANGIEGPFIQDNYSHSVHGALRGLHFQKHPKAQGKLVSVIRGEIKDVAVDIRQGSPTYGRWVGATLSSTNHHMLYVPIGFAHGFCVLSNEADVVYKVTGGEYAPDCEAGIRWNDPALGISWPVTDPLVSEKEATLPLLTQTENNFHYTKR